MRSIAALLVVISAPASADDAAKPRRAIHGSIGIGGDFILVGDQGDRHRPLAVSFDLKPASRFGVTLGWRAIEPRDAGFHRGLVTAGIVYEGAAARPRLVLDVHADVGADLDARAPLIGGGIRTTLTVIGPLGIVLDSGAYLILDWIDDSRLQLQTTSLLAARW